MKKWKLCLFALLMSPWVMGAGGGCETTAPTNYQVELNIPQSVRTCVRAKNIQNPGKTATNKQSAIFTAKLYYALEDCNANMDVVDGLYTKWLKKTSALNKKAK